MNTKGPGRQTRPKRKLRTIATSRASKKATAARDENIGTLSEWLRYLWPDALKPDSLPVWPPDAFAISAAFLRRTGAYVGLVNGRYTTAGGDIVTPERAQQLGEAWRSALVASLVDGKSTRRLQDA